MFSSTEHRLTQGEGMNLQCVGANAGEHFSAVVSAVVSGQLESDPA
jgi:hypothetical protein